MPSLWTSSFQTDMNQIFQMWYILYTFEGVKSFKNIDVKVRDLSKGVLQVSLGQRAVEL